MRRIFVSHSTDPADAEARNYVEALVHALEGVQDGDANPKFEVFYDRQSLEGGDDWNRKIVNHLIYCHGAVIVLSLRAMTSPYVQFEVANLMARRARERAPVTDNPLFPVVPVLPWYAGLAATPADFTKTIQGKLDEEKSYWKATAFAANINYVGPISVPDLLPQLVQQFDTIDGQAQDEAIARLEDDVTTYLRGVQSSRLQRAAKTAGFEPPPPGVTPEEAARHVARGLLMSPLDAVYHALGEMRPNLKDDFATVFDLLAPSWVSPEAARALQGPLRRQPAGSCAIVNAEYVAFTPDMYVRRARGRIQRDAGTILQLTEPVAANHDLADLRRRVRMILRDRLPCPGNIDDEDAYARALTKQLAIVTKVVPVVFAMSLSSQSSLPLLVELSRTPEFGAITFFGLCGNELFTASDPVICLTPELAREQEEYANSLYYEITSHI